MNQFHQRTNVLPPQQILQANGKSSIDLIQMSPNSSVLIADTTAPIVWRCVSDGLGNVTAEPFDISPHKDEQEIQRENFEQRLTKLEEFIYGLQSNSFTSTDTGYVTEYRYTRQEVDANTKRNAVKSGIERWVVWEQETKTLYERMYKELLELGEVSTAKRVSCEICAVDKELKWAQRKHIDLVTVDYSISYILGEQNHLHDWYKEKMHDKY